MPNNPDPNSAPFRKRMQIAREAARWVGSHYLWGAAGASPGNHEGAPYLRGGVSLEGLQINNPERISVGAASLDAGRGAGGKQVCCGRYQNISGGREIIGQDRELNNYLTMLRTTHARTPPDQIPSLNGLTPRWANWEDDYTHQMTRKLVWGEDCRLKQHFDCVHFINYVLIACGVRFAHRITISGYIGNTYTETLDKNQPWVGDIVTHGIGHIGFIFDANTVVHAKQSVSGVVREPYYPNQWTRLGRIRDTQLQ